MRGFICLHPDPEFLRGQTGRIILGFYTIPFRNGILGPSFSLSPRINPAKIEKKAELLVFMNAPMNPAKIEKKAELFF